MDTEAKVNTPIKAHTLMMAGWELVDALRSGSATMRASDKWLPREPGETNGAYRVRSERSFLFPAYDDTVQGLASRPFAEPVKLKEGTASPQIDEFVKHVDGDGRSLTQFMADVFDDALDRGVTGVLVDYPVVEGTLREDQVRSLGLRPTWVHVPFNRVIGWRHEEVGGEWVLTQLRIKEVFTEPKGEWGEEEVHRIKVYRRTLGLGDLPGRVWWEVHQKNEQGEYQQVDEGDLSLGYIPFHVLYTNRLGLFEGAPPLQGLAEKNLEHYHSSSDQRHILRFVRTPLLFAKGLGRTEMNKRVQIGPSRMYRSTAKEADMKYVEHTGKGVEAGQKDVEHLERQMELLGMEPLVKQQRQITATERMLDTSEETSQLQSWVRDTETFVEELLATTSDWMGLEPTDVVVQINDTYTVLDEGDIQVLKDMRKERDLSRPTYWKEMQKRGILDDDFDPAAEAELLEAEHQEATRRLLDAMPEVGDDGEDDGEEGDEGEED